MNGYYSLADFHQNNPVPELRLLTTPFDFSGIRIESASFQEIPLDDATRPNELVLSTGAGCDADKSRYVQMLDFAVESQAAAVIYTLRDESYDIPESTLAYADQLKVPVFFLPWEYRLSDIHAFVVQQIQNIRLSLYRSVQDELFSLFFDGQSLNRGIERISMAFGVPVEVVDRLGRVQARSRLRPKENMEAEKLDIPINGEVAGWLYLYGSQEAKDLIPDRESLEKFVISPLSLWFYQKNLEDMVVMKIKNNFVWDLANGNYASLEEMARQGRQLKFDLTRPYTCALLQVRAKEVHNQLQEYSGEAAWEANAIEAVLLETGKTMGLRLMVGDRNLQFVIYLENAKDSQPENYFTAAEKRLSQEFQNMDFYWGISETAQKAPDFSRLYHNASLALRHCMSSKSGSRRFTYKDTQEFQIISVLSEHPEIYQGSQEMLGKLLEYGKNSRMDLMDTLQEYIRCNYNTSLTARNLRIHRQSLLYRLEKIEALTGLSLTEHKDLFLLEVYARIFSDF